MGRGVVKVCSRLVIDRCGTRTRKKLEILKTIFPRKGLGMAKAQKIALSPESAAWVAAIVEKYSLGTAEGELLYRCGELRDSATAATQQLKADGEYSKNRFGESKPHPALRARQQSVDLMARILKQLGLATAEGESDGKEA
jgi:hypothetical protein